MEEKESVEYAKIMATTSAKKLSEYLKKLDISETETKKLIDLILEQVRDCIELEKGIAEELLHERKYLTLAQMEKVVGKKDFQEMVGNLIVMKEGSPTLVVETDKREAISNRIKAEEEFSAVEDINNL